ncbi:MAG: hypothetical protein O2816_19725 [Planctomycetota bacterium]|nr:hypothetical protein [Planctomycetota bacterium]
MTCPLSLFALTLAPLSAADEPWPGEERLPQLVEAHGLTGSHAELMEVFNRLLQATKAQATLPFYAGVAADPWSAPGAARRLTDRLAIGARSQDLAALLAEVQVQLGHEPGRSPLPQGLLEGSFLERMETIVGVLEAAAMEVEAAFSGVEDPAALLAAAHASHERLVETVYLIGEEAHARTWAEVQAVDGAALLRAAQRIAPLADPRVRFGLRDAYRQTRPPKPEPVEGVEGRLIYARETDLGWVLVGAARDNTYDLPVAFLFDLGGEDTYTAQATSSAIGRPVNVVLDLEGDDTYEGGQGQGAGVAGVSLVVDTEGKDTYGEGRIVQGAGLLGVGVLIDEEGDDVYLGDVYAQGAGCYGVGLLIDRDGDDRMTSYLYSQGFGSPLSVGALIDVAGDDVRECRGRYGSSYGTANEYNAFSQGAGVGFRVLDYTTKKASGGLGVLLDCAGNDRSVVGEFGHGVGYFVGTGIARDLGGNDEVRASRYGIATGAHYGISVVLDDAGDDLWHNPYTASLAGNWDLTLSFFLDRAGDDTYQAGGIGLGSATITSMACFVDGGGKDSYALGGRTAFGNAGHTQDVARGSRSLGMFLDLGGAEDTYPASSPLLPPPGNDLETARHQEDTHTQGEGDSAVTTTGESGNGVFLDE